MKQFLFYSLIFTVACGNNNTAAEPSNNSPNENKGQTTAKISSNTSADDIIGEWQLTMIISDANANNKIDENERKDAIKEAEDYLKLNSDGTCLFYTLKTKGRYEIKTQSNGKKILYLFDKDNNKENRGQVFSVSSTELIMLSHSVGSTFKIYKRL